MIETIYRLPCPVGLALLADFHNSEPYPILRSLEKHRPEVITIAGDLVFEDNPGIKEYALLRGCAGIAPTYVSLGNHEWLLTAEDLEKIGASGVILLHDRWARYRGTVIGGLSSAFYTAYQEVRAAHPEAGDYPISIRELHRYPICPVLDWLDDFEQQDGYRILLCHHPEYYPKYLKGRPIDLILSGHAHGGQWRFRLPFSREAFGVLAPGQGLFPRLTSGVKDGRLVISRGLSNPVRIPRINNEPEIVYIRPENG